MIINVSCTSVNNLPSSQTPKLKTSQLYLTLCSITCRRKKEEENYLSGIIFLTHYVNPFDKLFPNILTTSLGRRYYFSSAKGKLKFRKVILLTQNCTTNKFQNYDLIPGPSKYKIHS